ncbi:adenylate kinase [Patescibacteria group bacterium]|nr:adenylate kinase [Patescibacteria group bacterium]
MNIIIFGPQGSGKGTQAEVLAKKFNIPHISTGDIFRDNIKNQTELGNKAKEYIDKGQLVPDDLTIKLIKDRLSQPDSKSGFILDGYPRTIPQAEALDRVVDIDKVLEVWISDEESITRLAGRRSCPQCGAVYHLKFNPPRQDEKCDKCNKTLIIREDDTEEVIKKRLEQYHRQTEPLIEYYQNQDKHLKIDGMPPIPEVTKQINEEIK